MMAFAPYIQKLESYKLCGWPGRLEDREPDKPRNNLAEFDGRLASAMEALHQGGLWKGALLRGGSKKDVLAQSEPRSNLVSTSCSSYIAVCSEL